MPCYKAGMNTQIAKTDKAGRKRYLESERRELLRKFGASGMTQAAFCRANGLSDVTFFKWVRTHGVTGHFKTSHSWADQNHPLLMCD